MRGGPAFAVSLVLSSLEPALRAAAELGAWQIISPVSALGRVAVVGGLHEVQDKVRSFSALACHCCWHLALETLQPAACAALAKRPTHIPAYKVRVELQSSAPGADLRK